MDKELFIENFRNAFGNYELPVGVWYSDEPFCLSEKTKGCFIRYLKPAREGELVSFDADTLSCSGGKVYTGFTEAPPVYSRLCFDKRTVQRNTGIGY